MRNFLKTKTGEKQSVVRLMVVAGNTIVIGAMLTVLYCVVANEEPQHPMAFACAAFIGLLLLVAGTIATPKKDNPSASIWDGFLFRFFIWLIILGIVASIVVPVAKPVIYLYPQQQEDVLVRLDYAGKITADYPVFDQELSGWKVTAYPDGHLIDPRDGREYSYLFWEGEGSAERDWSSGFVVKGSETRQFLQDILPKLGLTPKEYNEFIVYWYPLMQANRFNLIHFAGREYTDTATLTVTPRPDTVIRVFMVWKAIGTPIRLPAQTFAPVVRHGFTVVEWGGTEVR